MLCEAMVDYDSNAKLSLIVSSWITPSKIGLNFLVAISSSIAFISRCVKLVWLIGFHLVISGIHCPQQALGFRSVAPKSKY